MLTISAIKKRCLKFNIPYSVQPFKIGEAVLIQGIDYNLINSIFGKLFDVDYNIYTQSAFITTKETRAQLNKLNRDISYLVDLFYLLLRDGKTAGEAEKAQKAYALENNMLEAFNSIYA